MKQGLKISPGPSTNDESGRGRACNLQPCCEGCDGRQLEECYDVRVCTNTTWDNAVHRLL